MKDGVFYFSRHIPQELRRHYTSPRIAYSLRTKSPRIAEARARRAADQLDEYWYHLRCEAADLPGKHMLRLQSVTGQRIGDVFEMRWSDVQDGAVFVRQNKTQKELWVPIFPELQEALDAASLHSVFIVTNVRGTNRWSYRGASQAVRKVREAIGALDMIFIAGATMQPQSCWKRAARTI